MERQGSRIIGRSLHRIRRSKLALQTAIIHLCCAIVCIVIGIFAIAIIESRTIKRVHGLPLWIGLLLLLTGFAGIQCHVKQTKPYAGLYSALSLFSMSLDLISIAWMLSTMNESELVVICFLCGLTFDMGISCLSTATACNLLLTECKLCKHRGRGRSADDFEAIQLSSPQTADRMVTRNLDGDRRLLQENVATSQGRRHTYEPPPYSESIGPPPPYSESVL